MILGMGKRQLHLSERQQQLLNSGNKISFPNSFCYFNIQLKKFEQIKLC